MDDPRALLDALFRSALARADPAQCLPPTLPAPPAGRVVVVGAGKAAGSMAAALTRCWGEAARGCVVTRYGHGASAGAIGVLEAGHPVPDAAGMQAARRILAEVRNLSAADTVVCLLSGGASALLTLPVAAVTLDEKQEITRSLLRSGAPITEINTVRKHLSQIKGGRLALACAPASLLTFAISDVADDSPATIGSGPTVADPTTSAGALDVLRRYGIGAPSRMLDHLASPASETPKPGDPRLSRSDYRLIATAGQALEAAADAARLAGLAVRTIAVAAEGEARELARAHAALVARIRAGGESIRLPAVLLSGGEATVTVRGRGRGGPNMEYALALAIELAGAPGVHALAADTDGIDGTDDAAGALIGPDTLARARARGLDPAQLLDDNDSYRFFASLGDLLVTGPTRTNVNDFRAILLT